MMETNFSQAMERDEAQLVRNNADHRKWSNPLEVQLPRAPSMKIYCVYGHGKESHVLLVSHTMKLGQSQLSLHCLRDQQGY